MLAPLRSVLCSPLWPWWLLVLLLPWGRSAELATLLCTLGYLWLCWRRPQRPGPGAWLWLGLAGSYLLAALLSVPGSLDPARSGREALGLLRFLPLGLYACRVIDGPGRLQEVYRVTAWLVLAWCLDAWVQMATGWSLGGPAEADRITGIFGAGNLKLGPVLAVLSPFLLWYGQQRWGWRGLLAGWLLLAGPVVLSGARSAWIGLGLAGMWFAWRAVGSWARMLRLLAVTAVAAMILAVIGWQLSPRFHARAERSLQMLDGSRQGVDTALTGRLEIWGTAWRMIEAHPLDGVGLREFRYAYPAYAAPGDRFLGVERCGPGQGACHPHQWILEVLSETGLAGALCWLSAILLAWRGWRRAPQAVRRQAFPATMAVVVAWFPFNTHLAFYSAWWGLLAAWLLALWCASLHITLPEADHGRL